MDYSSECVEGLFPEVRLHRVLRSSPVRGTARRGTRRGPGG